MKDIERRLKQVELKIFKERQNVKILWDDKEAEAYYQEIKIHPEKVAKYVIKVECV